MTTLSTPLRIVILEDTPSDAELMIHELRHAGIDFTHVRVETKAAFLKALEEFFPDLILSDYMLPQFTGMEALRLLKDLHPMIPLVLVTGSINEETAVGCIKAGAADYVLKDHMVGLPSAVTGALEDKKIREEKFQAEQALKQSYEELEQRVEERTQELSQANGQLVKEVEVRTRAEAQLAEAFGQIQKSRDDILVILNQLNIGTMSTDSNGTVTFLSDTAQRIFQQSSKEAVGRPWTEIFPLSKQDNRQITEMVERTSQFREKVSVEVPGPTSDHFLQVDVDIKDDPRRPEQKIFFLYDVTEVHDLRRRLDETGQERSLVGESPPMKLVHQQIQALSRVDSTVLIDGETGTGKELVARAIHEASVRKNRTFVPVNCAGLTESLVASQLFGHRRGAFTGAIADQQGVFEAANGGTLFLDEIGDIPLSIQTNLLRVLEERTVTRIGDTKPRRIDVRVIAAGQHNLNQEVEAGRFRADLLFRIRVGRIHLPPLRERREDIPFLVQALLRDAVHKIGIAGKHMTPEALRLLLLYHWPGNVRELKNTIEFAVIHSQGPEIQPHDLPPEITECLFKEGDAPFSPAEDERSQLLSVLEQTKGNRLAAAKLLGISRSTLYRRLARFDIPQES